jgi:hypothetical protein
MEDQISDQALIQWRVMAEQDEGLCEGRMESERMLDLLKFDAEATEFDLKVEATEEEEREVREQASGVAGPIEAEARGGGEGMRDEALGGEVRAREIATSQPGPSHIKLTGNANWHGLKRRIEDEDLGIGNRSANRRRAFRLLTGLHLSAGRDDGVFGWPVVVDEGKR